jgi:hypothetical protein
MGRLGATIFATCFSVACGSRLVGANSAYRWHRLLLRACRVTFHAMTTVRATLRLVMVRASAWRSCFDTALFRAPYIFLKVVTDMKSLSTIRVELLVLLDELGAALGTSEVLPLVQPARRKPRKERSPAIRRAVRRASHRQAKPIVRRRGRKAASAAPTNGEVSL